MRPTTVVVIAVSSAASAAAVVAIAGRAANVTVVARGEEIDETAATRAVWDELDRVKSTYALTDVDPFDALCRAYVEAWRTRRLELFDAAALAVGALRERTDFYFVLDDGSPEAELDSPRGLRREWYLGVVARAAPARVVAVPAGAAAEATAARVLASLAALPAGPELPDAAELVAIARRRVPGQRDPG